MSIAESALWAGFKALRTERKQSARDGEEKFGERFLSVCWLSNGYNFLHKLREFGIKHNRYINYSVVLAGDIAIFFTCFVLFKKACYFIPNAPINPSLVRIFIVPKIRLLSPDDALLH